MQTSNNNNTNNTTEKPKFKYFRKLSKEQIENFKDYPKAYEKLKKFPYIFSHITPVNEYSSKEKKWI